MSSFVEDITSVATGGLVNPSRDRRKARKDSEDARVSEEARVAAADAEAKTAADEKARKKRAAARTGGRASNVITGAQGLLDDAPVARSVLTGQ